MVPKRLHFELLHADWWLRWNTDKEVVVTHVEEEAVEHRRRNEAQRVGQQQQRQADEDVRQHPRHSRFAHPNDPGKRNSAI